MPGIGVKRSMNDEERKQDDQRNVRARVVSLYDDMISHIASFGELVDVSRMMRVSTSWCRALSRPCCGLKLTYVQYDKSLKLHPWDSRMAIHVTRVQISAHKEKTCSRARKLTNSLCAAFLERIAIRMPWVQDIGVFTALPRPAVPWMHLQFPVSLKSIHLDAPGVPSASSFMAVIKALPLRLQELSLGKSAAKNGYHLIPRRVSFRTLPTECLSNLYIEFRLNSIQEHLLPILHNPSLRQVFLRGGMTDECEAALASFDKVPLMWTELGVRLSHVATAENLGRLCPHVDTLELISTTLVFEALPKDMCARLSSLFLEVPVGDTSDKSLVVALARCSALTSLDLNSEKGSGFEVDLSDAVCSMSKLSELYLSDVSTKLTFLKSHQPQLKMLRLMRTSIEFTPENIERMILNLASLESLYLQNPWSRRVSVDEECMFRIPTMRQRLFPCLTDVVFEEEDDSDNEDDDSDDDDSDDDEGASDNDDSDDSSDEDASDEDDSDDEE
jgi:hypothetical protein